MKRLSLKKVSTLSKNFISSILFLFCSLSIQSSAHAQLPDGWTETKINGNKGLMYQHEDNDAFIIVAGVEGKQNDLDLSLRQALDKTALCGPAKDISIFQSEFKGARETLLRNSSVKCRAVIGHNSGTNVMILSYQTLSSKVNESSLFEKFARVFESNNTASQTSSAQPVSGASKSNSPQSSNANASKLSILKSVIDSIPMSKRPSGMTFRYEWDSFEKTMAYKAYPLFSNGLAISGDCSEWNPWGATLTEGCNLVYWKKVGSKITFRDEDGQDDPIDMSTFTGYKPGETIKFVDQTDLGFKEYAPGCLPGGTLLMGSKNEFWMDVWTGPAVRNKRVSKYPYNCSPLGVYYLDGFLIAMMDQFGNIGVGTIGQKIENGITYLYVNGDDFDNGN
jgi:hypothetical protein